MQQKTATLVLAIICVALLAGLVFQYTSAARERRENRAAIEYLSNQWSQTVAKLEAATAENNNLNARLNAKTVELESTIRELAQTKSTLQSTRSEFETAQVQLKFTQEQLQAARAEINQRDSRITQLETQYAELDKQANELKAAISELQTKITETEEKLAKSEGDREFLLKELKRMQTEKADLERKFNDLAALRDQYKKLKEELAVFRRIEWIRQGLYGKSMKGAELLQSGVPRVATTGASGTNIGLNVEIRRDGTATVLPPKPGTPPTTPLIGPPGTGPTTVPAGTGQPK